MITCEFNEVPSEIPEWILNQLEWRDGKQVWSTCINGNREEVQFIDGTISVYIDGILQV